MQVNSMYNTDQENEFARREYKAVYRRAFWRNLNSRVKHQCNDLVPAKDIFSKLDLQKRIDLGLLTVPLEKIVSSTGRYRDFDLAYLPRRKEMEDRWVNIARSNYTGANLPPVILYKVREIYIVEDGNHRVSVARASGQKTIAAMVIEVDGSMLTPEPSCTRLGFKV
jgi:hypothetical protein